MNCALIRYLNKCKGRSNRKIAKYVFHYQPITNLIKFDILKSQEAAFILNVNFFLQVRKIFNCGAFISQTIFMILAASLSSPAAIITCLTIAVGLGGFAWSGFG